MEKLYADQRAVMQSHPSNAEKVAGGVRGDTLNPSETAALVAVARTLMNLDEFVTRE